MSHNNIVRDDGAPPYAAADEGLIGSVDEEVFQSLIMCSEEPLAGKMERELDEMEDDFWTIATCSMQGRRPTMEDSLSVELSLECPRGGDRASLLAVYDGHGGREVADFLKERLRECLVKQELFPNDIPEALRKTFLQVDLDLRNAGFNADNTGATACVAIVTDKNIDVAGVGDTRCVLARRGRAICLTRDHKPLLEDERSRIEAAGGIVLFGRTNGTLAVSRAIGDFSLKTAELSPEEQAVSALPEVKSHPLKDRPHDESGGDDFVIIACDGIWDILSNDDVVRMVYDGLRMGLSLKQISSDICDRCVSSRDNMTIIVAVFKEALPVLLKGRVMSASEHDLSKLLDANESSFAADPDACAQ